MSSPALFAVLLFAGHAQGYTKFNTVCTAPNSTVNFVSSPDTRGTLDILWSCLFTMIACTYTVLHLNVPEQRAGRDPGWRGDLKWTVRGVWVSVKWMLVTILAPEILLSKNWGDLEFAKTATAMMERFAATDGVPWTLTHSLLANMGGFIIKGNFTIPAAGNLSELQELPKTTWQEITGNLDEGNELATILIENASAGKTIGTSHNAQSDSELLLDNGSREQTEQLFHVDALDIFRLRELGLLRSLPNTSLEEVKDKDKTDTFARVITVTQISWMVLQVITRAARHLPISQLEIAVVAFAACAIIIFGLNWQKPRSVKVPFTLPSIVEKTDTHDLQSVLQSIATRRAHTNVDSGVIEMFLVTARMGKKLPSRPGNPIRNTYSGTGNTGGINVSGIILGSMVFGGIHLFAWDSIFPSWTEKILWQVSSIWCTTITIAIIVIGGIKMSLEYIIVDLKGSLLSGFIFRGLLVPVFGGYVVARIFLLVEIIRTLFFLPPGAYIPTFAGSIPHFH